MMYHKPVLLKESIEGLAIAENGTYVDATFGGGGHSLGILNHLDKGRLFAFDRDEDAVKNSINDPRFTLINSRFSYIRNYLKLYRALPVDGIIADLGISSYQIDQPDRGFSTRFEGTLDMRMDRRSKLSAGTIIGKYSETELARVLNEYGQIQNALRIAKSIVSSRKERKIQTTLELKEIIRPFAERGKENKFLAQFFQALRIEVNDELGELKKLLLLGNDILRKGGRMVIISYHSLEDILVKRFFISGNFEGILQKDFFGNVIAPFKVITRKVIVPSSEEITENNRARSARLRIAEKI